jgi:hypothetical protein
MYAMPALDEQGRKIELAGVKCEGDGSPSSRCGLSLYFSHDVVSGDCVHRYASCVHGHTWAFTAALADTKLIAVATPGRLLEATPSDN